MPIETAPRTLPPEILLRIQTLSNAKDAARMATLSKNLYAAWSTRRNVDFDEADFLDNNRFWEYAIRTLQRYQAFSLTIETFTLRVTSGAERFYAIYNLLVIAARLEAVSITIELQNQFWSFTVPDEVFTSKHLNHLCVTGGNYFFGRPVETSRSCLTSLRLSPDIDITYYGGDFMQNLVMRSPSLREVVCDGCLISFAKRLGNVSHGLESLTLESLSNRDVEFFDELARFFPCLKNLCIRKIYNCPVIRIRSQKLVHVSLSGYYNSFSAVLDIPNLREFNYVGPANSCFNFEAHSLEWDSNIRIIAIHCCASWFRALQRMLINVSGSKLSLTVNVQYDHSDYKSDFNVEGVTPVVQRLEVISSAPCSGVVNGLLNICRPKVVNLRSDINM